jgi:diacylglycerol O-acyltransferase
VVVSAVSTSIERLTAEDRIMLWGDEAWPQEIAALAILDGSTLVDADGRFRIEIVGEAIQARLHLVPRFRQRLHVPAGGLGGPLWVDAPTFDIADHVQVVPLPAPADEAELLAAAEQLRRQRLDRSRPLWGMWFLTGLPDGRVGLFVKMHHVIADGIAGVAALGTFLDATPEATVARGRLWAPAPPPSPGDLLADNLRRHAAGLGGSLQSLARPVTTWRHVRAAWPAIREFLVEEPGTDTSLDRWVGLDRTVALVRTSLDQVKEVAHAHGARVNDVLLAATAGGLRGLLRSRGEPVEGVVVQTSVPVSLRQGVRGEARGNLIGAILVPLPLGAADPGDRLRRIAAETAKRKARTPPSMGRVPRSRIARRALLKVIDRQHVNVTTTNVPGPPVPLYLAGARVLEVFPVLSLIWNVSLGVGAMSYAGQFNIMAVADRKACPDLDVFAASMRDELHALGVSTYPTSDSPVGDDTCESPKPLFVSKRRC